ncbi:MAG: chemotaxis protein CheW [candidate division Zixibacteria bacterium CG_4_9_14_3_um_filter_46_8]|nr:MAG: chemotaxis protein CheW [candidate division Zixibacteria bacterium CG_4_9_14_3_um_filter_46_8]
MSETRTAPNTSGVTTSSKAKAGKYLTFRLADEEYGIEILRVREIIGLMDITQVPRTPHYVRGVINLRGKVIPVIDLRMKFDMNVQEDTEESCIIVVDVASADGTVSIGVLVDAVSEVLNIRQEEIEDAPSFGSGIDVDYILGIGKIKNAVKILLNINKVLDASQISLIDNVVTAESESLIEMAEVKSA